MTNSRKPTTLDPIQPAGQRPNRDQLAVLDWLVGDLRAFAAHHAPAPDLLGPDEITAADTAAADAIRDYADRLAARIAKTRHEQRQETKP
ncbi:MULTISPECIES: hypothetical protein [Bacteria]|uniref:Uncharacterized protein n=2 Tax=Bacteria TaxID=2 RepID=A0A1I4UJG1_9BURK|nr:MULTISPECIES: hypothetical protein [Bacteria]SFE69086.1 hypothetical protein SAMN05216506_113165 [Saccharopolyspora kobensis]SFM89035.1 hypothetical protein SAMN02982985_05682 [Rugamonas rubra]